MFRINSTILQKTTTTLCCRYASSASSSTMIMINRNYTTNKKNNTDDEDPLSAFSNNKPTEPTSYDKIFSGFKQTTSVYEREIEEQRSRYEKAKEDEKKANPYWKKILSKKSELAWAILGVGTFILMFKSFAQSKQNQSLSQQVQVHKTSTINEIDQLKLQLSNLQSVSDQQLKELIVNINNNNNNNNNNKSTTPNINQTSTIVQQSGGEVEDLHLLLQSIKHILNSNNSNNNNSDDSPK
ncbi:hypothetical protein DFA_03489 [Cavenderia fasciculata]|uniref:Uncharacterized protein n=1 Tax=Cavenderia fasciculata TaxID=261658 RepID=F4PHQ7_CACFS|nr:uncharacterized protein DFA_03489 [Cavenderia fasciculata]EGG25241.1 hypothetical protein DFA_03489 [Cavenderia fasciculata]|eukprot:XP_004363092.1 hypothetical protein DFA_03489 [Cavenderia fasciculata]